MNQKIIFLLLVCWLTVDGYSQGVVGEIILEGNSTLSTKFLLERFETREGDSLQKELLEQDIDDLISEYESIGHPFAAISVKSIESYQEQNETRLRITLKIEEGELVHIKEVRASGNKETKEYVIVREAKIGMNEIYDERKVKIIPQRLNRLNIFSQVNELVLTMNDSGGVLTIPVEEGNTNTFDGVLGYVPGSSGEDGFLTGLANVSMRNLFGTARKLNVRWQKERTDVQEIILHYVEPWFFNFPVDVGGTFKQRQQDTLYVSRQFEVTAYVRLFDEFTLGGVFSHESVIPSNNNAGLQIVESKTTTTGIELHYDTRDDMFNPTKGVYYRSDYRIGNKTFGANEAAVQKLALDVAVPVEIFQRQVLSIELHGKELLADNIGIGEMYRLGGTTTLRGYKEGQFIGSRIAWTSVEYRFLLSRRSFFFGFLDGGYYFLPDNQAQGIASSQSFKYGYGIGTRIETGIGLLGVSFAFGEGDSFSQGKIHFGIVNEF
ncbi:MAG: BamA/TamA family outer membrane protein [Ignavibacteriae bacterium]|nr:BamA/TamA family outer membrane protein [Ignavibacteriota bacterium]